MSVLLRGTAFVEKYGFFSWVHCKYHYCDTENWNNFVLRHEKFSLSGSALPGCDFNDLEKYVC